jgi:hypothetical protein
MEPPEGNLCCPDDKRLGAPRVAGGQRRSPTSSAAQHLAAEPDAKHAVQQGTELAAGPQFISPDVTSITGADLQIVTLPTRAPISLVA